VVIFAIFTETEELIKVLKLQ